MAARDDRDLLHGVAVLAQLGDDRVPALVVRRDAFVRFGDEAALLLRAEEHLVDAFEQLAVADHLFVRTRGEDRRFVQKVFKIRAREPARHARKHFEVHVRFKRFVARVYF